MLPHRDKPPTRLKANDARELWPELVDELAARGLLSRVTNHRLGIYCQLFAQYFRVTGFIDAEGQVLAIRSDKGEIKKQEIAPEAVQQIKLVESLRRFDKEFGFTEETNSKKEDKPETDEEGGIFAEIEKAIKSRMAAAAQT